MSRRILIVDDSKLARMSVAKNLTNLRPDWERIEATNADEAIVLATQSGADIALVDFNMPGRDGLSLAAELRNLDPNMPVALVSANMQQQIIDSAEALGATFLPKPLTEAALAAFLDHAAPRLEAEDR